MKRTQIKIVPEYFDRYINLTEDVDLFEAFNNSLNQLKKLNVKKINAVGFRTYQPGKWTINEIIQHITDIERLLIAGTLRFARGEENYIIAFNEEEIARQSKANNKSINLIIEELISVRKSTISLYKTFDKLDFQKSGINWKHRITIEAMGFNIIGHQIHHINFINDNYFSLLEK